MPAKSSRSCAAQPIQFLQGTAVLDSRNISRKNEPPQRAPTGEWWYVAADGTQEIVVENVAQFVAAVESFDRQAHGHWGRSGYVFRGMPNIKYELLTSLQRTAKSSGQSQFKHARLVEFPIQRSFRRYATTATNPPPAVCTSSIWALLAFAQHHHCPTRLLDWSTSALVALHFATLEAVHSDADAVVWCVQPHEINKSSAIGSALPKLTWMPSIQDLSLAISRSSTGKIPEEISEFESPLYNLQAMGERTPPFAIFFEAPSIDERIVGQAGLFSVTSDAGTSINKVLSSHPEYVRRIRISASAKRVIRQRLDGLFGITERSLWPGTDGIAHLVARWYSAADASAAAAASPVPDARPAKALRSKPAAPSSPHKIVSPHKVVRKVAAAPKKCNGAVLKKASTRKATSHRI